MKTHENRRATAAVFTALNGLVVKRAFRLSVVAVILLATMLFAGCVTEDECLLPWGAPSPSDGSVNLPRSLRGE